MKTETDKRIALFFIVTILFDIAVFFYDITFGLMLTALVVLLGVLMLLLNLRRQRGINMYVDGVLTNLESATKNSLSHYPLPMTVLSDKGEIIWYNGKFSALCGGKKSLYSCPVDQVIEGFDYTVVLQNGNVSGQMVTINSRSFRIYGYLTKGEQGGGNDLVLLYLMEVTDFVRIRQEYELSRPVVANIMIDNYDEISQNPKEGEKALVFAKIDTLISEWAAPASGILKMIDRGKYLFVFESRYLDQYMEEKFDILDKTREIFTGVNKVPVTISVGVGRSGRNLAENTAFANQAIDMALGRGGDQAVVKTKNNFEFYGGRAKGVEKRTKVKSRVMATALAELIDDCDNVIIMGHKFADFDAVGAAIGLARIAFVRKKPVYIVINSNTCLAMPLVDKAKELPEYENVFVGPHEGQDLIRSGTLLIIVDSHSPEYIESKDLYENSGKVALIDHHRRMTDFITDTVLSYHEPYASSTCEIVSELVQYIDGEGTILKQETEAMLAGIVLDTKNFYFKTGFRTFEAAAYLKKAGADPIAVKKLFQSDHESYIRRVEMITGAELYKGRIAISVCEGVSFNNAKAVMAQAADELLNIEGIDASFVLFSIDGRVHISARSLGTVNVQIITEKLGGGGHITTAGAQLSCTAKEAREQLIKAIEAYFTENNLVL